MYHTDPKCLQQRDLPHLHRRTFQGPPHRRALRRPPRQSALRRRGRAAPVQR